MTICSYKIVREQNETFSLVKFQSEINMLIDQGWQPLGPPHIVGGNLHVQAMVLPKKNLKKYAKAVRGSPDS